MITLENGTKNTLSTLIEDISLIDTKIFYEIEKELIEIFNEYQNLSEPVFLSVKSGTIQKLAFFMAGFVKRSVGVGIAGETASGKSTVTLDIIDTLQHFQKLNSLKDVFTRVNTDDYYYDRSEMVKAAGSFAAFAKNYDLDCPDAFELDLLNSHIEQLVLGREVLLPKYDMSGTAKRYDNHTLAKPSKIILSEGLYTLTDKVREVFDFTVYVDVSSDAQKERFFKRAQERNLGDSAYEIYNNALNKALIHVKPTKEKADIVVNGEADRAAYKNFMNRLLSIAQKYHFSTSTSVI